MTGAGGIGKTRLALHVAHLVRRAFCDGAWLVELAPLREPKLLTQAIADRLSIRDESGHPLEMVLTGYLADKSLLLVLDNCEHLIDACAELAGRLLCTGPDLRILATSREPLRIRGEQVFDVPPLATPDTPHGLAGGDLRRYEAVALLYERASAAVPGFTAEGHNEAAMAGIAQQLDGLPLAIELAAVRLKALSPAQLLQEFGDVFGALGVAVRGAEPRQRTLRSMIDWSFDLCSPAERALWGRISVFSGSFDLEAVEAVCATDGGRGEGILDLVTSLIDKSILIREEHPCGVRYRLLDTIRQYGQDRLEESGRLPALRRRHRDYYERLSKQWEAEWYGPRQLAWIDRMRLEQANIRVALEFCLTEPGEAPAGVDIVVCLRTYWHAKGSIREGRRWIEELLTYHPEPSALRVKALLTEAWLALYQNDVTGATQALEEIRALAERFGYQVDPAVMAHVTGLAALMSGDAKGAATLLHEALARYRAADDAAGAMVALFFLTATMIALDDQEQAMALARECISISESLGEVWIRGWVLWTQGIAAWRQGDTRRAARLERDSIRLKQHFNNRMGVGQCIEVLAWTAATEGDARRAARMLGEVEMIWREFSGSLYQFLARFHREVEAKLRTALGPAAFEEEWSTGVSHTYEDVVASAVGESPAPLIRGPEAESGETGLSPLTPREREVAELIAQGMSNRRIAAELVISQRTAEGHVEHIMTKLGFTSRTQIAAWLIRQTGHAQDIDPSRQHPH